ncbi:MAG TPA: DUF3108 domain-containing protein [Geobacteraceae bacterium]
MRTVLAVLLLGIMLVTPAQASFTVPERLVFDISWSGIVAGTAIQEVSRDGDGVRIVSTARSADWLSVFFTVDDRIEAVMGKGEGGKLFGLPKSFREKIREGPSRYHKDITFDHVRQTATIFDHREKNPDRKTTSLPITPITYDSLSCFYYARLQKLEPGGVFYIDIFDGKRLHTTEVRVLRRETLTTNLGVFKTVVIMPVLETKGIFSKNGELFIWLTDDERRIPVLMKSKVKIGSVTATLTGGSYWPQQAKK